MNSKGCILLVDDDELVLGIGAMILDRIGYKVLEAKNSAKAVEIFRKNQKNIDLVILDI